MYPGHWGAVAPDRTAVIVASSGQTISFAELDAASNRLAQRLAAAGLRAGDRLAVFAENHPRYFEIAWAALRSGLHLTPVNRYLTAPEAAYIVQDCEARALITTRSLADVAGALADATPACELRLMLDGAAPGYEDYDRVLAASPARPLDNEPRGEFFFYSSGTTGRPKGIVRRQSEEPASGGLPLNRTLRKLFGFDESTVYLSTAPLYHSAPLGFALSTQSLGGTVVLMDSFDAAAALDLIGRYGVTHSQWVPTMFARLLRLPEVLRSGADLSSHRCAVHGAAPCPPWVKQQILDWWGPIVHEYYGGTESNGLTYASPDDWLSHPGTVGRAVFGRLHICADDGAEVPIGDVGNVYFELPALSFAYHNDPDQLRAAQHPAHPSWTTIGDVGRVDGDGFLYLTDRATFMIISGGVNIYPQEIEDCLLTHPLVADVAVIGVPSAEFGEEVKAVVELRDGTAPSDELAAELLAYSRARLSHYKCPRSVDFEAELPRLPTGKLYKRALRDRHWGEHETRLV